MTSEQEEKLRTEIASVLRAALGPYKIHNGHFGDTAAQIAAKALLPLFTRVPPPPDRGMVEKSLSDTGELLRQAEVAALEWLNCDRYSKRLGALRALPDCDDTNGRKNVALRMLRAVRASTASQPQPERVSVVGAWQSMDSAPKDGTSVLGFDGLGIAIMDWWQPDQEDLEEGAVAGWVSHSNETEEFIEAPTHWMPLPAPPSTQTLQGEE